MLWRRKWQPTPVCFPGESHGQRSLLDYSGTWLSYWTRQILPMQNLSFLMTELALPLIFILWTILSSYIWERTSSKFVSLLKLWAFPYTPQQPKHQEFGCGWELEAKHSLALPPLALRLCHWTSAFSCLPGHLCVPLLNVLCRAFCCLDPLGCLQPFLTLWNVPVPLSACQVLLPFQIGFKGYSYLLHAVNYISLLYKGIRIILLEQSPAAAMFYLCVYLSTGMWGSQEQKYYRIHFFMSVTPSVIPGFPW